MELTIYRYLLSFALICTPALFGAAQSSEPLIATNISHIPSLQELATRALTKHKTPKLSPQVGSSTALVTVKPQSLKQTITRSLKPFLSSSGIEQISNTIIENPVTFENVNGDYIMSIIDELPLTSPPLTPATIETLKKRLYTQLARALAADCFISRGLQHFSDLPPYLRQHFTGVSIQELLDHNVPLNIYTDSNGQVSLDLRLRSIDDLTGLNKIPGSEHLQWLNLRNNYIEHIALGTFAGFTALQEVWLLNNPIAPEERARIEAEIRAVTGRDDIIVRWQ